ncbi:diaminobutyrate--2-oxoglutarate transaminase, partial [Vibrio cholerae]
QKGLIIETAGAEDEVLKVFCPLTITEADLAHGLTIIERSAARIAPRGLQQAS